MGKRRENKTLSRRQRGEIRRAEERRQAEQLECRRQEKKNKKMEIEAAQDALRNPKMRMLNVPWPIGGKPAIFEERRERLQKLVDVVCPLRPGLVEKPYLVGLTQLSLVTLADNLEQWVPAGRGLTAAFRSLAVKALGGFPASANLIDSLLIRHLCNKDACCLAGLVKTVISGGSVYDLAGTQVLPAPLTRRMCHLVANPPRPLHVEAAVRWAQVLAYGGSERLAGYLGESQYFCFKSVQEELFCDEVIHWLCRQGSFDHNMIEYLMDYLEYRRNLDPGFRMKGRSIASLYRAARLWNKLQLDLEDLSQEGDFQPSGLAAVNWHQTRCVAGNRIPVANWELKEILTPLDLLREGRALRHCVDIYSRVIREGTSSIWSLSQQGCRVLTIEVSHRDRAVVEVRGKCNRLPRETELWYVLDWARKNRLAVKVVE